MGMNPWATMWVRPRETIQEITTVNPKYGFWPLAWIYGFPLLLQIAQNAYLGKYLPAYAIVLIAIILACLAGFIGISIVSGLMLWTGKWIKGGSNYYEMRAAIAWSNVPNIVTCITWIILTLIFGRGLYFNTFPEASFVGWQYGIVFIMFIIQLIMAIWSLVIFFKSVSEVQGFSVWKAILNGIFTFVILFIVITVISTLIWGIGSSPQGT